MSYPPNCDRSSCGHNQSQHDPTGVHNCTLCACPGGFVFPAGYSPYYPLLPNCGGETCGQSPEKHDLEDPHACAETSCEGYKFPSGYSPASYTGGGGGFGGGGATGGW